LGHLTENFVPQPVPNRLSTNFESKITFQQQEISFSGEKYERKISEKIPMFHSVVFIYSLDLKIFHQNHDK